VRIPRIYQDIKLSPGITIQLDKPAANHIVNVLRLSTNDSLIIFNGEGGEYSSKIISAVKRKVSIKLEKFSAIEKESPLKIHLLQGISRGEKMDFSIQKTVELGVSSITPIITERCGVKLSKERWGKRLDHWQKIIISACEQCERNSLPQLFPISTLTDYFSFASNKNTLKLTLNPYAQNTLSRIKTPPQEIVLLIGPEGGLTDLEIQLAEKNNFKSLKIGSRILRTETAALTVIAALQSRWGDLA
jgi:16S rRNA (uracil1498-N3)-methyltransferase